MELNWDELNPLQKEQMIEQYICVRACEDEITEEEARSKYSVTDADMCCHSYRLEDNGDLWIDI